MTSRAQMYIEKHKITALFEELMNNVVRNAPDNPLVYIIIQLYKKAGLSIPIELKTISNLKKSSPDLTVHGHSSEIVSKSAVLASWASKSGELRSSSAPSGKDKATAKSWPISVKTKNSSSPKKPVEAQSTNFTKGIKGQTSEDKQEKPEWNSHTKTYVSTFDEYAADTKDNQSKLSKSESQLQDSRKSWTMIGLDETDDRNLFQDGCYTGPKHTNLTTLSENDILSDELIPVSRCKVDKLQSTTVTEKYITEHRRVNNKQLSAEKHKAELERLIMEEHKNSSRDMTAAKSGCEDVDSALELLENPDDLMSEGIIKLSPVGYKLSKTLRQREENAQVRLNINLYSAPSEIGSVVSHGNYLMESRSCPTYQESLGRKTPASSYLPRFDDSDDEFDSVSQVSATINERHLWNSKESEGETYTIDTTHSPYFPQENSQTVSKSVSIHEPARSYSPVSDSLLSSAPNLNIPQPAARSSLDMYVSNNTQRKHKEENQHSFNTQQLERLKRTSQGWNITEESDGSTVSVLTTGH